MGYHYERSAFVGVSVWVWKRVCGLWELCISMWGMEGVSVGVSCVL